MTHTPSTPTEFALLQQIKVLERKLYIYEMDAKRNSLAFGPQPVEFSLRDDVPPRIELYLTADLAANVDRQGRLSVHARAHATDRVMHATYIEHLPSFTRLSEGQALDAAARLHERFVRNLADALEDGHF